MSLADDFRTRAQEQRTQANDVIQETSGQLIKDNGDATLLVTAIVGHVSANLMEVAADTIDYQQHTNRQASLNEVVRSAADRNNQLRKLAAQSAASGSWDQFDEFVNLLSSPGEAE